jgi:energy-coupling factor transporter ATP-binding protein EcfA2
LLLDEPTNSLDPESIDALAKAINEFEGGMVLVSHDMRLISQVAKEIWICDNKTITPYKGDIQSFKLAMRKQMGLDDGTKQAPKTLRGDASVKIKDATATTASKEPKKVSTKPKPVTPEPKIEAKPAVVMDEDDTTVATTITASSTGGQSAAAPMSTAPAPATPAVAAAPVKGRYVPPHLRKKMMEEQQSSS